MFRAPKRTLGDLDATSAAELIAAAADIALIIDAKGVIRDVSLGDEDLQNEGFESWLGTRWVDTVTVESRPKVEELLQDIKDNVPTRWRQVNHPSKNGSDIPMRYAALRVSDSGRIIAVGRDLRPMAALQQRLVDAQQS
ncbi:MAG: transcriptional regulator PpsR, partial [Methyloceanibacter sp.]